MPSKPTEQQPDSNELDKLVASFSLTPEEQAQIKREEDARAKLLAEKGSTDPVQIAMSERRAMFAALEQKYPPTIIRGKKVWRHVDMGGNLDEIAYRTIENAGNYFGATSDNRDVRPDLDVPTFAPAEIAVKG